jgi:uncharacterized protein YndB with AHSA1/START domain
MAKEYVFIDEWDVSAPRGAVFEALSDASTYPRWWTPVYIDVETDGPPEVGRTSRQHFKGRLPYHVRTRSVISELDPPHVIAADVDGDLRGRGVWTLTAVGDGTHVRFDWQVHAAALEPQLGDRPRDGGARAVRAAARRNGSGHAHRDPRVVDDQPGGVVDELRLERECP